MDDGKNKLNINDLRGSDQSATASAAARLKIADVLKTPNRFGFQPERSQLQPSIHHFDNGAIEGGEDSKQESP